MGKKVTIKEIREVFSKFGLTVLDEESKGVNYKYKVIDEYGYLYSRSLASANAVLRNGRKNNGHIFSTKNDYFYENMLLYIEKEVKTGTVLLSKKEDIKNIDQHLFFKCGICGREYKSTWHIFMRVQDKMCNFCFNQKRSKGETNTNHNDTNKFHKLAMKNGYALLSGPDIKYHNKVVIQDKNGYKGLTAPSSIIRGCGFERFGTGNPYTIDNMRLFAFNNGWDCVIYDQEYKGDKKKLKLMCSCGNDFYVDINHFVTGKYQCNECRVKQSAIAASVELYLNKHNIKYEKEYTFDGCFNKKKLPFDFYLNDYNACIEVDGIGHYRPVSFSGNKEKAEEIFKSRQVNDEIKTNYCKNNNIPLLRIPFWEIEGSDNYRTLIDKFLSLQD